MVDKGREPAVVREASCSVDDHYGHVVGWVHVTGPGGGWGQGFGGICLSPDDALVWTRRILDLFGVSTLEECKGRNCVVLRAWPGWGSDIEGLEVDGRRFTLTDFRRERYPETPCTPIERKRESLLNDLRFHGRRVQEDVERLERLHEGYVDWSVPTSCPPGEE